MRILAFALPLLAIPALLLGGCSSDEKKDVPPGGIYRSVSAGASFEQSVNTANSIEANIASFDLGKIHRSLKNPNTIVIAAGAKGVVISYNDGETWEVLPVVQLAGTIDAIQLPDGILIATGVDNSARGVTVRSLDNGKNWENVLTIPLPDKKPGIQIIKGPTAPPSSIVALEIDPKHPDKMWAGTNDGTIFVADQAGRSWRKVGEVPSPTETITGDRTGAGIVRLIASQVYDNELLIVTKDKRLLMMKALPDRQAGSQMSEIKVPESISVPASFGLVFGSRKILNISLVSGFPDALLLGTSDGAVVTRDKGKSYLPLQLPIDASKKFSAMALAVSPNNVNRIFITIDGIIYRSEDSGSSWSTTDLGASGLRITDISINPNNPAKMLVVAKQTQT